MDENKERQFESILKRYNLSESEDLKPIIEWLELEELKQSLRGICEEDSVGDLDAEELIRLTMLIERSPEVEVKGCTGDVVKIKDKVIQKFLLSSLYKLLQIEFGGEEDKLFTKEKLEVLLTKEMGLKHSQSVRAGRSGKNIAFLGDKVTNLLVCIPDKVKQGMNKTELLNFAGEVMALAGLLRGVPKWKELSDNLARSEKNGWDVYKERAGRARMLKNWLAQAKKVYLKLDCSKDCKKCKDFKTCKGYVLKFYDI